MERKNESVAPSRRTKSLIAESPMFEQKFEQKIVETPVQVNTEYRQSSRQPMKTRNNKIIWILGIIALVAVLVAAYSMYKLHQLQNPNYQQRELQAQVQDIVARVSKLIKLPEGDPQIYTVSDIDTLKKTQPFFSDGENGDTVLVYVTKAILYRSSDNMIINVAPVSVQNTQGVQAQPSPVTPTATQASSSVVQIKKSK